MDQILSELPATHKVYVKFPGEFPTYLLAVNYNHARHIASILLDANKKYQVNSQVFICGCTPTNHVVYRCVPKKRKAKNYNQDEIATKRVSRKFMMEAN